MTAEMKLIVMVICDGESSRSEIEIEGNCCENQVGVWKPDQWPYLIFVTGTTGGARVKNSVRCKFFQIERAELHILNFLGYLL